ncbi:MAG TPA: adenine deaminase [Anaerolineae bacterium]|nr:adenine deaminase [Anaerolineae bacterium]
MELSHFIKIARGDEPADLLLKGGQVVNVFSGEVIAVDVAIADGRIVGLGPYSAKETIDVSGKVLAPGFIDAHVHIESSMAPPPEFAHAVVPRGTTTVVIDPHEIGNVLGLDGIRYMFDTAKYNPLSIYVMMPSCVPATNMETAGAVLHWYDIAPYQNDPWVLGLAEMMNFPGVVYGVEEVLDKLRGFEKGIRDGHAPGLSGQALNAYVAAGIGSDHECTTVEEAREKLRLGMLVFIREATNAHNLEALLPLITPANARRFCWCTDDRQPADLLDQGHIDYLIRRAIQLGLDPITAIRIGTLNPAEYFRLHDRGAIAPGRRADIAVLDDLRHVHAALVFRAGKLVARAGELLPYDRPARSIFVRSSMNVHWDAVNFKVEAQGRQAHVIGAIPDQLITEHLIEDLTIENGEAVQDVGLDLLKIAVIERHTHSGNHAVGFVKGIGLRKGAIASSVAHDHHNIVVIGADDQSMLTAARAVGDMHGGMSAAQGSNVVARLPLPIAGLMSDQPIQTVRAQMDDLLRAAHALGSTLHDPFMAMSFLALAVIPELKITDQGLVDVVKFQTIPLFVE